jgi:hypothetical protein
MSLDFLKSTVRWLLATNSRRGVAAIILAVFFANSFYLLGFSNHDAIGWTSNLVTTSCHLLCGNPSIDPNTGWLTTDLGHRAAIDLLHGHWPWWNQYEGLGSPLVGEMQAGALSPFVLFLALPNGLLYMHMAFELLAGVATYFWIRRLGVSTFAATIAGILFALNATFAWVGNATLNPICFLPLALLGVELLVQSSSSRRHLWWVLALAVAGSLYAGFPEVALFDTIFVTLYAVVRLFVVERVNRRRYVFGFFGGVVAGLVLSAPVLVAFKDFSQQALVGMHGTGRSATIGLPMHALSMFLAPYSFSSFFQVPVATPMWSFIGGYFGLSVFVLALYGTFSRSMRPLRLALAGYVVVAMPAIMGITPVRVIWNLIPFVSQSLLDRYIMPSVEMALIVLAVLALDDIRQHLSKRRAVVVSVSALVLLCLGTLEAALTRNYSPLTKAPINEELIGRALPFIFLAVIIALFARRPKRLTGLLTAVLLVEMTMNFMIPTYWAPASIKTDMAPVAFLRDHLGLDRFMTLGPIAPNWGSYFGISELNEVDLPFPEKFAYEIKTYLAPGEQQSVNQFFVESGVSKPDFFENAFATNIAHYEQLSVKYLVSDRSLVMSPQLAALHLKEVFSDSSVAIYELPSLTPFYSTWDSHCTIDSQSFDSVRLTCPHATVLNRNELALRGWKAVVNGRVTPIVSSPVVQTVRIPAGTSTVTFSYLPKHEKLALALGGLGFAVVLGAIVIDRRRVRGRES